MASEGELLSAMESLGVNVRRHGHLAIGDLKDATARAILGQFVFDVMKAGRWGEVPGLYLHGPVGTGKSQAAVSVIRELLRQGMPPHQIVYDRGRAVVTQLQDRYTTGSVDAFSEQRRRARLWIYEDAGTEKLTADSFRVIEDIFDRREGSPTIITTNLTRSEFVDRWKQFGGWERMQSRLGPYRAVTFSGVDFRLEQSRSLA